MSNIKIHANYPGANIKVGEITDNTIMLEQEIRDTTEWWFYWNFCVESPPEGEFVFEFTNGNVVGPWGPSASFDRVNWDWLGSGMCKTTNTFKYVFKGSEKHVYFSMSLPYQLEDFERFFLKYQTHPMVRRDILTTSEQGRLIPLLRIGEGTKHVFFIARSHACESVSNYLLEGLMEYIIGVGDDLLADYCFHVIPFMDIDGVENGDQGKSRHPHDHNRDYTDKPIYNANAALMDYGSKFKPVCFIDFHCPWIWHEGDVRDKYPFFVKMPSPMKERIEKLSIILRETTLENNNNDRIVYDSKYDIESGVEWNKPELMPGSSTEFFDKIGSNLVLTVEMPYFGSENCMFTQKNTRIFGLDFGRALKKYFKE